VCEDHDEEAGAHEPPQGRLVGLSYLDHRVKPI
jgi:hypothetical protein